MYIMPDITCCVLNNTIQHIHNNVPTNATDIQKLLKENLIPDLC